MLQRVMMDVVVQAGEGGEVPVFLYRAVPGAGCPTTLRTHW